MRWATAMLAALACMASGGCAVVTVAGAAISVGATAVGVAADVAVGAVKVTGKAVGAAVDAVTPGSAQGTE
ncbi:hypothetical protein DES41_101868 [Pseudorhodoferax soli]|uniref:Lipoprotein n=2 Tax=Pseudorhodoferax soli TaxID=545864 RepID=A0A368Y7T3_9BURK|nr:hypothetical protein DES41_101868 [Pseudorhodoferax soli]